MEDGKPGVFGEMKELVENSLQDRMLLMKLEASERMAALVSRLYIFLPLAFLLFFILGLVTFLAGYYLSVWLGAYWIGFGIVLIIYIFLFYWLWHRHKNGLQKKVADKVVESIFGEH